MTDRPSHRGAIGAALLVTLLWSSSWVLIRWGLDDESLEPLTFAAIRYALAALVLAGVVSSRPSLRRSVTSLDRRSTMHIVVLGVLFYAVTQGAQFVAIDNQPAATTTLVLSASPLLVALIGAWSIGEPASSRQVTGTVLVASGAAIYFAGDLGATAAGLTAATVGLSANVASSLLGRRVNRAADIAPVVVTALSMAVGATLLVAVGIAVEGVPTVSARAWLIIAWLSVVNTALAFTLWNLSLRRLTAVESSAINNTMTIQIALLAWIFLEEPLGLPEAGGIALVTLGILLTQTALAGTPKPRRR